MIRVSKLTDYGILILRDFAADPDRPTRNAKDVARRTGLPAPTVSKLMKRFVQQGLLTSLRGVKGGYGLSRDAGRISIAQIIEAVEGPIALTDCNIGEGSCDRTGCPASAHWHVINVAIHEALEKIPLARMVEIGGPR